MFIEASASAPALTRRIPSRLTPAADFQTAARVALEEFGKHDFVLCSCRPDSMQSSMARISKRRWCDVIEAFDRQLRGSVLDRGLGQALGRIDTWWSAITLEARRAVAFTPFAEVGKKEQQSQRSAGLPKTDAQAARRVRLGTPPSL